MKKVLCVFLSVVMVLSAMFGLSFEASATEITLTDYVAQVKEGDESGVVPNVTLTQDKINYLSQNIVINNVNDLLDDGIDTVKIFVAMYYGDIVTQSKEAAFKLEKDITSYSFDYPTYGKFTVTLDFFKADVKAYTLESVVGIIAEEYNIACLNASFPVIYYTLDIQDKAVNDEGEPIPSFISLERDDAYNWDCLSENVFALPNATQDELHNGRQWYGLLVRKTASFVKDLYELCPSSKFNLYTVDNYCENILIILTANRIPEDQYKAYLLSDGSGSYSYFNSTFDQADSFAVYNEIKDEWNRVKKLVHDEQSFKGSMVEKYLGSGGTSYQILAKYAYVIANEEANIDWWLARVNDTLQSPDADFLASVKAQASDTGCIKVKAMNAMLTNLQNKGDEAVKAFKDMYKFNDSMFAEAVKENKKVMIILGTRVTGESNFDDFSKFVMKYYGDDYVYYYKGHPATPTGLYPEKQSQLDRLGIIDVESSVAAELIIFFYPDIYMCGYRSSTFLSVSNDEMACALFNTTKGGCTDAYGPSMDSFISKIDVENDYYEPYSKYCTNQDNSYYLVEFNNSKDIASMIYDATTDTIINFKDLGVNPVYSYSVVDGEQSIASGEGTFIKLPENLENTTENKFVGWSDGTVVYPGGATIVLERNTTFTAVWDKIETTTQPTAENKVTTTQPTTDNQAATTQPTADNQATTTQPTTDNQTTTTQPTTDNQTTTTQPTTVASGIKKPKNSSIKKFVKGKKSLRIELKKISGIGGYQIQLATDKNFKKNKKTVNVSNKKNSATIKGLKAKTKYYVRVRTYKSSKINGTQVKVYSDWSKAKTVKTK